MSCKKKEPKSYYWVFMENSSPIIKNNNYSYRLQNWAEGAIGNFCNSPENFKGKVTQTSAFALFFELEDLMCYTVLNRDSVEISKALEYFYYTDKDYDISRHGILNEVHFTMNNMWEADDSIMYVYLRLNEIGNIRPLLIDTLYLKEYKFHHY